MKIDLITCLLPLIMLLCFLYTLRWRGGKIAKRVEENEQPFDNEASLEWWGKAHTEEAHLGSYDGKWFPIVTYKEDEK